MRDHALRVLSIASFVLLAPLLFVQARRVRRVTPRLPPANGPHEGITAAGPHPLRLLIIGESTAVGVGVSTHLVGLAGQTARALAEATGRPVFWRVLGRSGASARALVAEFIEPAAPIDADVVVIALGVNDTISLSSVACWVDALEALLQCVRGSSLDAAIILSGVPPMQRFPAFPAPLRYVLGLRAHVLDRAAITWARGHTAVRHVPHPPVARADVPVMFCADRFHPSASGYALWGAALAAAASDILSAPARRSTLPIDRRKE
jgi:lysophospholipase L1-like esterase